MSALPPNPEMDDLRANPVRAGESPREGGVSGSLIDWGRTARRMRTVLATLGVLTVVVWTILGVAGSQGFRLVLLGELVGLSLLVAVAAEVVIVGGAALRGLLRAGERGDRLASPDVSLLPPQVRRRQRGTGPQGRGQNLS